MSRIPPAVVAEVQERAAGYCEACAMPERGKMDLHHRQARGMGGSSSRDLDVAGNLLYLHHRCHMWVHAHPKMSREHGWIVPSWEQPRQGGSAPWLELGHLLG
jgi:hypothetical protein